MENILVNIKIIKKKEKEYIIIMMEINMMVNGKMINLKEKEYIIIIMEINMMVNGKMIGDRYDGQWTNGNKEGRGIMYFNNGEIFHGEWEK